MIEEPLTGGNVLTEVVRVGNAVRRPATASTPFANAFLQHHEREGFQHAPSCVSVPTTRDAGY